MSIDPKSLRAGDFFQEKYSTYYLVYFVKEVHSNGLWIERMYRPEEGERNGKKFIRYSLLAGHGGLIEFSSKFWNDDFIKLGYVPALVNERSIKIEL